VVRDGSFVAPASSSRSSIRIWLARFTWPKCTITGVMSS